MIVKENTNIVQSNFLLENRPKLTKDETRLFITIVGAVNKDDEDFKPLQIPVSEFAALWGVESNAAYRKIKAALRGLRAKEFFVEGVNEATGKMRFLTASYISAATYEQGEGCATVEISQIFKPYLLELKKNYTRYILENILNLSTVNAIRNYELLKQYESLGKRSFSVDEYKKILGIEKKYSRNTDLRVNVIDTACDEINEKTDISVSYEFLGRGQKGKITFTIEKKEKKKAGLSEVPKQKPDEPASPPAVEASEEDEVTNLELDLLATIPQEVHKGEIERVRAVLSMVSKYVTDRFLDFFTEGVTYPEAQRAAVEDYNERVLDAIRTFNVQEYNVRKKGIRNPEAHYKYYLVALEGWLLSTQL